MMRLTGFIVMFFLLFHAPWIRDRVTGPELLKDGGLVSFRGKDFLNPTLACWRDMHISITGPCAPLSHGAEAIVLLVALAASVLGGVFALSAFLPALRRHSAIPVLAASAILTGSAGYTNAVNFSNLTWTGGLLFAGALAILASAYFEFTSHWRKQ